MKLSRKNLNLLIERMLFEDLSEIMYNYEDGEYSHKKGDQLDPYTYKVVGGNKGTDILVKIVKVGKGTGQKLAKVGAQFKINKQKLFNPNIQSLYAAIVDNQSEYKIKGDDARRPRKGGDKAQGPRGSRPRDFVIHKDLNSLRTALALQYKNIKRGDSRLLNTENKYIEGEFTKADAISGKASIDTVVLGTLGLKNFPSSKVAEVNDAKRGFGGFTETMSGLVDAFKPADVVYVGHLEPKIADKGPSTVYAEFLIKLDQRDFAIIRVNDINFDNSKTGGSKSGGEAKLTQQKGDSTAGLGTSMSGGSLAIQESFGRSEMKNFMRGLLTEAYEEGTPGTSRDPKNKSAIKIENKKSPTGAENQVFAMLRKTLKGANIGNVYYIWDQWNEYWDGAPQQLGKPGSEYGISGNNDPYTYAQEGNKYRVISGPKPGPIGKLFNPKKGKAVTQKKEDDPQDDILSFIDAAVMSCDEVYVNPYKEYLKAMVVYTAGGSQGDRYSEIGQKVMSWQSSNRKGDSIGSGDEWLNVFTDVCNTWREASKLHNDVLAMMKDAGFKTLAVPIEEKQSAETVAEGLSRGSLYRKRYYGRY